MWVVLSCGSHILPGHLHRMIWRKRLLLCLINQCARRYHVDSLQRWKFARDVAMSVTSHEYHDLNSPLIHGGIVRGVDNDSQHRAKCSSKDIASCRRGYR